MNVLMLGQDYQYAFAPLGAEDYPPAGMQWRVDPVTGRKVTDGSGNYIAEPLGTRTSTSSNVLNDIAGFIKSSGLADAAKDTITGAVAAKYGSQAAKDYGKTQGWDIGANMPWLVLGGAGLIAVLLIMGTRKK